MDDSLARFAEYLADEHERADATLRLLLTIYRRQLESLPFPELQRLSAAIDAEQMAHTLDLAPTQESLINALVRFREDRLRGRSLQELASMINVPPTI